MKNIIGGDIADKDCPNCNKPLVWQEYGEGDVSEYGLICENNKKCKGYELIPEDMHVYCYLSRTNLRN